MHDKRSEQDAKHWGILDKMKKLECDLLKIPGILEVEFDIRDWGEFGDYHQVIIIPKYHIDPSLPCQEYFDARKTQLEAISRVCAQNGLYPAGDPIQDMGEHWYIVWKCDHTWTKRQSKGG